MYLPYSSILLSFVQIMMVFSPAFLFSRPSSTALKPQQPFSLSCLLLPLTSPPTEVGGEYTRKLTHLVRDQGACILSQPSAVHQQQQHLSLLPAVHKGRYSVLTNSVLGHYRAVLGNRAQGNVFLGREIQPVFPTAGLQMVLSCCP